MCPIFEIAALIKSFNVIKYYSVLSQKLIEIIKYHSLLLKFINLRKLAIF